MNSVQPSFIHYLLHQQIDKKKWDACLQSSDNPLIYATSFYLDNMCPQWDGLVMNDYEAIMPLPWNKKYGIRYVYSPYYVVAGGVFGKQINQAVVEHFIKAIPNKFKYLDLDLNENNLFPFDLKNPKINFKIRTNIYLDLAADYQLLYSNYSTLARRKIKKASRENLQINASTVQEIIGLYKQIYKDEHSVLAHYDYNRMIAFFEEKFSENVKTYVVKLANNEVCAFYLLLYDERYVYWLIGGSTEAGKKVGAFYFLTDAVIQDFANTKRIFRFEGSDIEGIAFFNMQFGGHKVFYPRIIENRLPWPISLLKR